MHACVVHVCDKVRVGTQLQGRNIAPQQRPAWPCTGPPSAGSRPCSPPTRPPGPSTACMHRTRRPPRHPRASGGWSPRQLNPDAGELPEPDEKHVLINIVAHYCTMPNSDRRIHNTNCRLASMHCKGQDKHISREQVALVELLCEELLRAPRPACALRAAKTVTVSNTARERLRCDTMHVP